MAYPPPHNPYGNPYGYPNSSPYGNMYPNPNPNANMYPNPIPNVGVYPDPNANMYVNPYPQVPAVRRYQIRQKIFSFGDKFTITDEVGQPVFNVRGKVFSLGRKLDLEDMNGRGLYKIHQEVLRLHRTYKILSAREGDADRELATVQKKFSFFNKKFSIESVFGEYTIDSIDIFSHAYVIRKQGQVVANISRAFFTLADTYGVEIVGNEDHGFIIALAIVIDQVLAQDEQNQANNNRNSHVHVHRH